MSPFYPSNYPSNADCRWQIQVPDDYAITLEFEDFDTEWSASCTKDWLQVSTGSPETVVSKYCAKRVYPPLETRSNVVILDFHSDGVTSLNKGFTVHYRARKIPGKYNIMCTYVRIEQRKMVGCIERKQAKKEGSKEERKEVTKEGEGR